MKYFTSDIHHDHKNICSLTCRKNVTCQEEHTEWLVNLWNKQVTNNDQVYALGDFSFSKKYNEIAKFTERLNGQIFLIKGNHDRAETLDQLVEDKLIQAWYDYKEITLGESKTKACLFHYPMVTWNKSHYGSFALHGHCHGSYRGEGKILDVGLDSAYEYFGEHRMFTEQDIFGIMQKKIIHVIDHHNPDNIKE